MDGRASQPPLARWIATVLRLGTLAAVAVIAVGLVWATIAGQPRGGTRPVIDEISAGGGDGVTAVGLLALTLLPILMLCLAAAAFRRAGEPRMVLTTLGVGALIVASLVAAAVIGPSI